MYRYIHTHTSYAAKVQVVVCVVMYVPRQDIGIGSCSLVFYQVLHLRSIRHVVWAIVTARPSSSLCELYSYDVTSNLVTSHLDHNSNNIINV